MLSFSDASFALRSPVVAASFQDVIPPKPPRALAAAMSDALAAVPSAFVVDTFPSVPKFCVRPPDVRLPLPPGLVVIVSPLDHVYVIDPSGFFTTLASVVGAPMLTPFG